MINFLDGYEDIYQLTGKSKKSVKSNVSGGEKQNGAKARQSKSEKRAEKV
ncbi:MAG: hypothetical protein J7L34_08650 [Thermotogaceae bacterium]|nr:hypothetical protein [Thermotogaceae bacterium]